MTTVVPVGATVGSIILSWQQSGFEMAAKFCLKAVFSFLRLKKLRQKGLFCTLICKTLNRIKHGPSALDGPFLSCRVHINSSFNSFSNSQINSLRFTRRGCARWICLRKALTMEGFAPHKTLKTQINPFLHLTVINRENWLIKHIM